MTNCTLSGNTAGRGGAIANEGTLTIADSTVNGNTAVTGDGGGIWNLNAVYAVAQMRNTIVAGNFGQSSSDFSMNLVSLGHNLIGDGTGGSGYDESDLVGTSESPIDPLLGPLQDNGGPTWTMALLPGSRAVDAGDNANAPDFDQRGEGFDRIVGGTIDIGAFEAQIGSATSFQIDAPPTVPAGMPFDVTVTALDAYNHVASGYVGTVRITTSDPGEGIFLPPDYTFTPKDGGSHTFPNGVTLVTPGDQIVTATDTKDDSITGSATVTVTDGGGAPRMGGGYLRDAILELARLNSQKGMTGLFKNPLEV